MAPRANWKGYLKLSLVSCPIALYPASSEREKIRFHQINKKTGNRIKLQRVDAETGEPVEYEHIMKGYEVGKDQYIEITDEELEAIALESTRTIDIDEFVPKEEIAGGQGRSRCVRGDPRRYRCNEQGRARAGRLDQPRARYRHRTA